MCWASPESAGGSGGAVGLMWLMDVSGSCYLLSLQRLAGRRGVPGRWVPTGASDKTAGESRTLAPCEFFFHLLTRDE